MMRFFTLLISFFFISWLGFAQGTITPTGSVGALTSTYGYVSGSTTSFSFSASGIGANGVVTITAPTGFEVSSGSGFGPTATVNANGGGNISSTSITVRLSATVPAGPYGGGANNITLACTSNCNPTPATASIGTNASTVNQKPLNVSGLTIPPSKIYDGTTSAAVSGTAALLSSEAAGSGSASDGKPFTGDAVTLSGTANGTYNTKDVATATTVTIGGLSLSGAQASNYVIQQTGAATITVKTLTVSGLSAPSKVYDGTTTATVSGTAALQATEAAGAGSTGDGKPYTGDVVSLSGTASGTYNTKDVATATTVTVTGLSLTGGDATNYTLNQGTLPSTITTKTLNVSGLTVPPSKIYDGSTSASVSGTAALLSSEAAGTGTTADGKPYTGDAVSLTGSATGTYNSKDVAAANTVTTGGLGLSGAQATNYSVSGGSAAATITAKALTMTGLSVPASKVYDGTTNAVVSGSGSLQTAESVGSGSTGDGKPYTGDVVSITGSASGTYNSKDVATASSVTYSGLSLTGGQATNYSLTMQSAASATITAKALTVSGITVPASKIYDGSTSSNITGTASLLAAEAPGSGTTLDGTPYTGDVVSINAVTPTGTYNSKNVASATTVVLSGLSLSGAQNSNYSIQTNVSATITTKALTMNGLSVAGSKIYDGTTNATVTGTAALQASEAVGSGTTADGIPYTGDVVSITGTATGTYNSKDVATASTVTYGGLSLTGAQGTNYSLTVQSPSAATITTKALTISGLSVPASKVYDGTTNATVSGTASPLSAEAGGSGSTADGKPYTGDVISITGTASGTYNSKDVATATTVAVSGLSLSGAQSTNYSLSALNLSATITKLALTITGATANSKNYDGTTTATVGGAPVLNGVLVADAGNVTLNSGSASGTFASAGPALNISVTTSGYTLSGTASGDYSVTQPTLSANIYAAEPAGQTKNITFTGVTAVSFTINWQLPSSGAGTNRLVLVNEGSAVSAVPVDYTSYTPSTDWTVKGSQIGTGNYVVYTGTGTSVALTNLNANTTYYVQAFEFNGTPGSGLENYNTGGVGSNNPKSQTTNNYDVTSTFSAGTGSPTIASIVNTQAAEVVVFQFTATDPGTSDGVSTRFTQLIFRPGTGNQVADWTQIIAGAELYDNEPAGGTYSGSGPTTGTHGTAIITANTITIPSISAGNPPDLGSIADNSSRIYYLKIWLKSTLGGTLPSTIDNQHLAFSITGSDVTAVAAHSAFTPTTTTNSGATNDQVTVTATKININQQPSASTNAYVALATQPIFEATDVNNNRDLDINNAITVTTSNPTDLVPASALSNFASGLANFTGSGFNFHSTGTSTMAVSISTPNITSPNSNSITVTASTNLGSSATVMSSSPLTNGTTGTISGGTATNALLGFNLQTTGSPLTLSGVVFTSNVSATGLFSGFTLYSNTSDSFTGATQVGTSSSLTFTGLSVTLGPTATYFFLVGNVSAYFPYANPTIQFSLPAGNFTVSTGTMTGSTQTGLMYSLQDLTPPSLQYISTMPAFTNSWALSWPSQMTTPAYNGNTADFIMTFSEPVLGVTTSKLTPVVSGLTIYSLVSVLPCDNAGNTTSSPSQYWRISYSITGSNNSGTVNGGYVFSEFTNTVPYVTDIAGNTETHLSLVRAQPSPPASDFYYVALPRPTNPVTSFVVASITTTSVTLNWTQPAAPTGQIPTHYLIRGKEHSLAVFSTTIANGQLIPDDPDPSDGYVAINVANSGYPALTPATLSAVFNLKSGMSYDFEIYDYSKGSYPGIVQEIDYNPTSATLTTTTTVATSAFVTLSSANPTISSLTNSQAAAQALAANMVFNVQDEATDQDNAPTKFSAVTITGSGVADLTQLIAGAVLTDGTTTVSQTSITATQISFTGLASTNPGDLGYVPDGTVPKSYSLYVWLKASPGGTLPTTMDNVNLVFTVTNTSFVMDNTSSNQKSTQFQPTSASSGSTANKIDVTATKLVVGVEPSTPIGVGHVFPAASTPTFYAQDANGNRDLNYAGTATITNSASLTQSVPSASFSAGVLALSSFTLTSAGGPTTITATAPSMTSATTVTGVTTVISGLTNITAGAGAEPLSFSSLITTQAASVQNFDFAVTDDSGANTTTYVNNDGLPTLITAITLTQDINNGINGGGDPLFDDWTNSIAGAVLSDGVNFITASSITATTIVFSGIPIATGNLGYVIDDGTKTYTLRIWLKNPVNSALSDIIDNKDFVFDIANTTITLTGTANTSSTFQASSTNSGDGNNKVDVIASQLDFTTQWAPNANESYDAPLTPTPAAKAHDANGNVDVDWTYAVSVSSANPAVYPLANQATVNTNGQISFNSGLQVTSGGGGQNGTPTYLTLTSSNGAPTPVVITGSSVPFILNYSGNSDIIRDASFTYPTNINYASASSQVVSPSTTITSANGIGLEQFLIRDGGSTAPDADGTPTVLTGITLDVMNYQNLREIALFDASTNTNLKQLTVATNAVLQGSGAGRISFTGFSLSAPDNNNPNPAKLLIKASFLTTVTDDQQISFSVVSVTAANVSSSQFGNTTPTGITSVLNPASTQNKVLVTASQLVFTNPSISIYTSATPATASLNSNFTPGTTPGPVALQAQDANGNLDIDFVGTINSLTNASGYSMNNTSGAHPNVGTDAFVAGTYTFPSTFQFTSGVDQHNVTLTMNAGSSGGISGTSGYIKLVTSFESSIQLDPNYHPQNPSGGNVFPATIPYVTHTEGTVLASSYPLIHLLLVDGSRTSTSRYGGASGPLLNFSNTDSGDGKPNGDTDGASTNLDSLSINLTNPSAIKSLGLVANGVVVQSIDVSGIGAITSATANYTFTFYNAGSTLVQAADDSSAVFSIVASFRKTSPELVDGQNIQLTLIATSVGIGSKYFNGNPSNSGTGGPYIGGHPPTQLSPVSLGLVDVVATSLDFTTQPSSYAGINEPIGTNPLTGQPYSYGNPATLTTMPVTTAGIVTARDVNSLVDTGFATGYGLFDSNSSPSPLLTTAMANPNFVNGVLNLTGVQYQVVGNGKIAVISSAFTKTVTLNGTTSNVNYPSINSSSGPNASSVACSGVTVLDVTVTQDNSNNVVQPSLFNPNRASLKGGVTGYNIFGLKFTANNISGSEPYIKGFYINFDVPYETNNGGNITTIFKNFVVKEVNSAGTNDVTGPIINGTLSKVAVTNPLTGVITYSQIFVDLSNRPQPLGSEPFKSISFFLYADVDANVNLATPAITPSFLDKGYPDPSDGNSIVSNGTSSGTVIGNQYSFASTNPPTLLTSQSDLTRPFLGQDNVDPFLNKVVLQFDASVGAFDIGGPGNAEIWSRTYNVKVADLILDTSIHTLATVNSSSNTISPIYKTLTYKVVSDSAGIVNTQTLGWNQVYYVKLPKGNYDAVNKVGVGISDFGLNFFTGLSTNSGYYFKTSNKNPPVLNSVKSTFNTTGFATLTTNFDQLGTAYYLILQAPVSGTNTPPTVQQVQGTVPYAGSIQGSFPITSIGTDQVSTFAANLTYANAYEVYLFAVNDAVVNGVSAPVPAAGVYGNSANRFVAGTTGPTLIIPAGSVYPPNPQPTPYTYTPNLSNSNFQICADSYVTITQPIVIGETPSLSFAASYIQDFNILLPTGYQFDIKVAPNIQLFGTDFQPISSGGPTYVSSFKSNSVLNIQFLNGPLNSSTDFITISGLRIIGLSGSAQGPIQCFYGKNVFPQPVFPVASIATSSPTPVDFVNSYWQNNVSLYNVIAPQTIGATPNPPGVALAKTVNAIPDDYKDANGNNSVQLIPDSRTLATGDYLGSTFSGSGVTGDLLVLNAVTLGAPFKISISHTDLNGCITTKKEQYVVYDHRNTISDKLGNAYQAPSPLVGTQQAIPNYQWPAQSSPIVSPSLADNELAGYTLLELTVDLPASEIAKNFGKTPSATQLMSGSSWRNLIRNNILVKNGAKDTLSAPFSWDYSAVLNALAPTVNSSLYKNINTSALGLLDVYDYFKSSQPSTVNKYSYWLGGSLGKVEFTGIYRSTADNSVYNPFRQNVELFVPAVPVLEVTSSNAMAPDKNDPTMAKNNAQVQLLGVSSKIYPNGYPGTSIFCENGGLISISGYPLAAAGTSTGVFGIYDYASYDFTLNAVNVASTMPSGAFIDNKNGTMTLDPLKFSNQHNDILVTYTYQANNSPAVGVGYLVIRVTPNPVASFTISSVLAAQGAAGASAVNAFCVNNNIQFDASNSTIATANTQNSISNYTWDFGDPNSGLSNSPASYNSTTAAFTPGGAKGIAIYNMAPNSYVQAGTPATQTYDMPVHYFSTTSVYTVNLSLTSNWGCPSLQKVVPSSPKQTVFAGSQGQITVGEIPIVDFSFYGNCETDPIYFADNSKTQGKSTSGTIAQFDWQFGDGSPVFTGYNKALAAYSASSFNDGRNFGFASKSVSHAYAVGSAGSYQVLLTTTTDLGCQATQGKGITILPWQKFANGVAYDEEFNSNNGGWQALNLTGSTPVPVTPSDTSWTYSASNGNWLIPSGYKRNQKAALHTACLDLSTLARPVIQLANYLQLDAGEGMVLQFSKDSLNIQDSNKSWTVLGTTSKVASGKADPGLDWYNQQAIPSNPGTGPTYPYSNNSSGFGWQILNGAAPYIQPKHALDTIRYGNHADKVILRFAFASVNAKGKGIKLDSVRIGSRTRTILLENFTSTNPGSSLNTAVKQDADYISAFTLKNIKSTQLVDINYHVGFLGPDPFNQLNPADPSARALYYGVDKVPYAFFDGVHSQSASGSDLFKDWGQGAYDLQTLNLANADFMDSTVNNNTGIKSNPTTVRYNSDSTITIDVNVTPRIDLPLYDSIAKNRNATILNIAILERLVTKVPTNAGQVTTGETQFEYVLKEMLPNAMGTRLPTKLGTGGVLKTNTNYALGKFHWIPGKFYGSKFTVVLFLQNEGSRAIYQSDLFNDYKVPSKLVTAIEPLTEQTVNVYPNPSDKEFMIELPNPVKEKTSIRLTDQLGRMLDVGSFEEGEQTKSVNTLGFSDGVYILQIGDSNSAVRKKIMVVHR